MLLSYLTKKSNTSETVIASTNGTDKGETKYVDEATIKKFEKDNKMVTDI